MSSYTLTRQPKNTLKLEIVIPWAEIETAKNHIIDESVKTAEIKGFRKGMAPRNAVEKTLDPDKILQEALKDLIPEIYAKAVKELDLRPVLLPQIHIDEGETDKDWKLHALTCERPEVKLGEYKDKLKGEMASLAIWTPDKAKADDKPKDEAATREEKLTKIIDWLLKNITTDPSDLLVEEETNRMLSRLFDQLQKLGLTVEQYLASKNKTTEDVKAEFAKTATDNLKLEFILEAISQAEKTVPSNQELQKWIDEADPESKKALSDPSQRASLASVLARRKTLDFLLTLA